MNEATNVAPLQPSERDDLHALVRAVGEHRAAELLHVSRLAVMRAVAGFAVRYPTALAIREGLRSTSIASA